MEGIFFILVSAFGGYIANKLDKMEAKIDALEDRLARVETNLPKRKFDKIFPATDG